MKIEISVLGKLGAYELECLVEIGSEDLIKEQIFDQLTAEHPEILEGDDYTPENVTYDVIDWRDLDDYDNLHDLLEELADYNGCYELDVISAGVACDVEIEDIDEAYAGHFDSDEDFAEDMAEQLGYIPKETQWPLYCIDWECAARDLMHDYSEENGYYFRSF